MNALTILALCASVLISTATIAISKRAPVFIYDNGHLNNNMTSQLDPFKVVGRKEFKNIMRKVEDYFETIIFFFEDNFSLEDVTAKDSNGTGLTYFREKFLDNKLKVLLQVTNPYSFIKNRYPSCDNPSNLTLKKRHNYIFVSFPNYEEETRIERLRRHQELIQQDFLEFQPLYKGPIAGIYTSNYVKKMTSQKPADFQFKVPEVPLYRQIPQLTLRVTRGRFEFFGFAMTKNGKPIAVRASRSMSIFIYGKLFTCLFRFECRRLSSVYFLHFRFETNYPIERGWKTTDILYYTKPGKKLCQIPVNFKSSWGQIYYAKKPLTLPSCDPRHPHLHLRGFKIYLTQTKEESHDEEEYDTDDEEGEEDDIDDEEFEEDDVDDEEGEDDIDDEEQEGGEVAGEEIYRAPRAGTSYQYYQSGPSDFDEGISLNENIEKRRYEAPWWEGDEYEMLKRTEDPEIETLITPGILMGLLVFGLIFFVYIWGLSYIMTLHTNSKYDNLNSKPLFDPETIKD